MLLAFFLIAAGPAVLHRVLFGRWSAWSCLAFLLLIWGFVNYLFGVGLILPAVAAWVAVRRRGLALRLAVGTLAALVLYFAHLMAAGAYGVLAFGYEGGLLLRRRAPWRHVLAALGVAAATFLPALAILVFASPDSSVGTISFAKPWRKFDLLFSVFDLYSRPLDVACFAIDALGLGWAYARRWVRLEPAMVPPLALPGLAYLAMPSQLMTASGADRRLPLVLALVLLGGSTWTLPRLGIQLLCFAAAGVMLAARVAMVAASWHASERVYASALGALDSVPVGSRIAVAFPIGAVNAGPTPLVHLPTLAVPQLQAFVPTLFAYATQQPVALRPAYRRLADRVPPVRLWLAFTGGAPLDPDERAALDRYDYVVFVDRAPFRLAAPSGLEPVSLGPRFQLYRVAHEKQELASPNSAGVQTAHPLPPAPANAL